LFYTGVNRGLLTICTISTYFLHASFYVVAVNCDPLRSPSTHSIQFPSCSIFVQRTRTISILSCLGWLSPILKIYSRVLYCYYYLNLIGYVTLNTASYLEDANVVINVHWVANPHVPIHYAVYRTVVFYLLTKDTGMISSVRCWFSLHLLVAIDSIRSLFNENIFQYK
jgi:hypothetical protein